MIFTPQKYSIEDIPHRPFVDVEEIESLLRDKSEPSPEEVEEVLNKSLSKKRLSMSDVAVLIRAKSKWHTEAIFSAARELKHTIYGNRIVLFAPLYVGNNCVNNCLYCGFRKDNHHSLRHTLSDSELEKEVHSLTLTGHKRLVLVYGESPAYGASRIAGDVKKVYAAGRGDIRRVNINAAPMSVDDFRKVKDAGIGTFQIFQESYHPGVYASFHPCGPKADYASRLTSLDRAMEAGIDDVGIGALLGLGDAWFELLALVRHTNHLEACYGVGPHTVSFPRIKEASNTGAEINPVSDDDFVRFVAILRLAIPYTGLILTAREPAELRERLIDMGVSQIDAGTKLEIGGYSSLACGQDINREQFRLSDERSLGEVISSLAAGGLIPSFCTACYCKGRTGEHFMEFSVNGFIKRFCTPNALLTFAEYLEDYACGEEYSTGWELINSELDRSRGEGADFEELLRRLDAIKDGTRNDLF